MLSGVSVQIAVRLADDELRRLDAAIARGTFASRAEAVRAGLGRVLREEREGLIEEAYRRACVQAPDDAAVGEVGLALGARLQAEDDPAG